MPNLRKSPPAKDDHAIRQDFTNPSVFGKDPEPKVQASPLGLTVFPSAFGGGPAFGGLTEVRGS